MLWGDPGPSAPDEVYGKPKLYTRLHNPETGRDVFSYVMYVMDHGTDYGEEAERYANLIKTLVDGGGGEDWLLVPRAFATQAIGGQYRHFQPIFQEPDLSVNLEFLPAIFCPDMLTSGVLMRGYGKGLVD